MVKNKHNDGLSDGSVLSYNEKVLIKHHLIKENGAPERIRTSDRSVRSRVLYPAELRALKKWRRGRDSNPRYLYIGTVP